MKGTTALFLQVAVVLMGIATLTFLLWEPHVEGRNAHATTFEIYFKDPFLAYVYIGSIPFFVALFRAFRMFGHVRETRAFSQGTVDGLKAIKYCAMAVIGFVAGAVVFIIMFGDPDDRPAGIFMSFLVTFASSIIAVAAAIFSRKLINTLSRSEGMS